MDSLITGLAFASVIAATTIYQYTLTPEPQTQDPFFATEQQISDSNWQYAYHQAEPFKPS